MKIKNKLIKLKMLTALMVVMLLVLAACGGESSGDSDDSTVKIGQLLPFTGTSAANGESMKNGFELYLEENDNKLGDRHVEVMYEDTEADPQIALRKYKRLVTGDKVDLLVGPFSTSVAEALRDKIDQDEIILINDTAAGNSLSWDKKSDYLFRVSASNWQVGSAQAKYIAENIGKKAVSVSPDYVTGHEVANSFKSTFEESGGTVEEQIFPELGTSDFAPFLEKIKSIEPDVVFVYLFGNDANNFVKQYDEFGLKGDIPLAGTREFGDALVTESIGEKSEGMINGIEYTPWIENEKNEKFTESYKEKYDELPNLFAVYGYDAAQVIDLAISETGSIDSDDLSEALSDISFDSPRGSITIDSATHNPIVNFYIAENEWVDGQIVPKIIKEIEDVKMPEKDPNN